MKQSNNKAISFFRRNAPYLVLALCVLAVALSTTFVLIKNARENSLKVENPPIVNDDPPVVKEEDDPVVDIVVPVIPDEPEEPVVNVITFSMPVLNPTSIESYSDTMVWNSTLKRYSGHRAMDFFASEGTAVCAVYDGVIEEATNDIIKGVTVVINHGNGLKTTYNSLSDADNVTVGQTVKKGDVIGYVSVSNRQESSEGAHLHFEVSENGETIDPVKYLTIEEK